MCFFFFLFCSFFFFFKQKTAYEIYQCDWSSDVCSSDLGGPHRVGGRELVFGAVNGKHRQALPGVGLACRPHGVGELHGLLMDLFKGGPRDVGAGFGHRTAMNGLRVGPEPTAARLPEQRPDFAIDALALPAGGQRQQHHKERGQRQFPTSRKGRGGKQEVLGGKLIRNETKKRVEQG